MDEDEIRVPKPLSVKLELEPLKVSAAIAIQISLERAL